MTAHRKVIGLSYEVLWTWVQFIIITVANSIGEKGKMWNEDSCSVECVFMLFLEEYTTALQIATLYKISFLPSESSLCIVEFLTECPSLYILLAM